MTRAEHPTNLASIADALRARGLDAEQVGAALTAINRTLPAPRPEAEVGQIAERACTLRPATPQGKFGPFGDGYSLTVEGLDISLEIDRLRRERQGLAGELAVRNGSGILSLADFNVSSARSRQDRAKFVRQRGGALGIDWLGLIEKFCQLVLEAERQGQPAIDLRTLPRPDPDDMIQVDGLSLPKSHPSMIYGDGASAKSYLGLHIAGSLAEQGMKVALFDWELCSGDHRDRLERLFGPDMPEVAYVRCERPLVDEIDRLRRIVRENGINYAVYDSVAFACDGPPESAEIAGRYLRAVRQIGIGSLHISHVSRSSDDKPFGSIFWFNGLRSIWLARVADESASTDVLDLTLVNRKANLSYLQPPVCYKVIFAGGETTFEPTDAEKVYDPNEAVNLSIRQRTALLLRREPLSPEQIAAELGADLETVRRTIRRYKDLFTVADDGKVSLQQHRRAA